MKTMAQVYEGIEIAPQKSGFVLDTTFVLFFLAVDCGQRFSFGIDGLLSGITLIMFIVLPYFLPYSGEKPAFEKWIMGRTAIASFAILLGAAYARSLGTVIPEVFGYLPMTLLIFAGTISFCTRFFSLFRLRLAK